MTLQRFARWWSIGAFIAALVVLALTYLGAHAEDRLPLHHPWPSLFVISMACFPFVVPEQHTTRGSSYKIATSTVAVTFAIIVNHIT
ncbi:MAG: hypothetical protein JNL83_22040 [Myxococcales bacterium]|nr:hypothetical protein [Myxococcales bacterium]